MAVNTNDEYEVYMWVIEDVVSGVEESFMAEGVDKQVLLDLQQIWLDKLNLTKAVSPTNKHPFRNLDKDAANVKDTNLINVKSSMGTLKGAAVKNIVLTHTINLPHNTLTPQNTLSSNLIHKSFNNAIIHTPLLNKNTSPLVIKTSTHAKTTSQINPSIPSFVPASDVCNDSSLTCQLLNKINEDQRKHFITLQKQSLVPLRQKTSLTTDHTNIQTTSKTNILAIPQTSIQTNVQSKLLMQLQQNKQNTLHRQIRIQQPSINVLNNTAITPTQIQLRPHIQLQAQAARSTNIIQTTLKTPQANKKNISTNVSTSSSKLVQLDGLAAEDESDDEEDEDEIVKMSLEDENVGNNGIYDDDEDEDRDKPEETLVSDDDISITDPSELFEVDNIVVCQYTKVNRKKVKSKWEDSRIQSRWSLTLRFGVMNINGIDVVFNCLQGEATWP